jgi:hypothetical protein
MKPIKIVFYLLMILMSGCKSPQAYHFFVAGHTYGTPVKKEIGLHPPFVEDFSTLRADSLLQFGVFTGDIVYHSRDSFWDAVDTQVATLLVPVYFAAGNHDEGNKPVYKNRYGNTYYSFTQEKDLCIVLNPGLGGWNIWDEQLDFLKTELFKASKYRNIFVFFHQVLWWAPDNEYRDIYPNSLDGRAPTINFWDTVVPLLVATERPVYCFAGDIGANQEVAAIYASQYQHIHFIASGMGSWYNDNYLVVKVSAEKEVEVNVRWLRPKRMEPLETATGIRKWKP